MCLSSSEKLMEEKAGSSTAHRFKSLCSMLLFPPCASGKLDLFLPPCAVRNWISIFKLLAIEPTFFQESKAILRLRKTQYFPSLKVVKDAAKSTVNFEVIIPTILQLMKQKDEQYFKN